GAPGRALIGADPCAGTERTVGPAAAVLALQLEADRQRRRALPPGPPQPPGQYALVPCTAGSGEPAQDGRGLPSPGRTKVAGEATPARGRPAARLGRRPLERRAPHPLPALCGFPQPVADRRRRAALRLVHRLALRPARPARHLPLRL